ncbi:MAG: 5-formyltetrahydrofolate cyclo-ligase [Clostridia bacterium]|nr:5-formyltetrahydrofolate cyclo-ligase [Clostridia bacterium]
MNDLRPLKKHLRAQYKALRDAIPPDLREKKACHMTEMLVRSSSFAAADTVLAYVSVGSEVSTQHLLEYCFENGKRIAVPKCTGKRKMHFCLIDSFDRLAAGTFGIPEPDDRCARLTAFDNTFCIVPGLSFDAVGGRLGYGGGYYDSFLAAYTGTFIGVCFADCIAARLPRGRYDVKFNSVLTEKGVFLCHT